MSARADIGIFVFVNDPQYEGTASVKDYANEAKTHVAVATAGRGPVRWFTVPVESVSRIPGTPRMVTPGKKHNRAWKRKQRKNLIRQGGGNAS